MSGCAPIIRHDDGEVSYTINRGSDGLLDWLLKQEGRRYLRTKWLGNVEIYGDGGHLVTVPLEDAILDENTSPENRKRILQARAQQDPPSYVIAIQAPGPSKIFLASGGSYASAEEGQWITFGYEADSLGRPIAMKRDSGGVFVNADQDLFPTWVDVAEATV